MYIIIMYESDRQKDATLYERLLLYDAIDYIAMYPHRLIFDRECTVMIDSTIYNSVYSDIASLDIRESHCVGAKYADRLFLRLIISDDTPIDTALTLIEKLSISLRYQS